MSRRADKLTPRQRTTRQVRAVFNWLLVHFPPPSGPGSVILKVVDHLADADRHLSGVTIPMPDGRIKIVVAIGGLCMTAIEDTVEHEYAHALTSSALASAGLGSHADLFWIVRGRIYRRRHEEGAEARD